MGRASRLKANQDRDRYQREREANDRATRSQPAGRYIINTSRSLDDLVQAAAMHEAGHVVAAVALGFGLKFAIIHVHENSDEHGAGGYTEVSLDFLGEPFDSQEQAQAAAITPDALRVRTMQALAGQIAEGIVNKNHDDVEKGSEGDVKDALRHAMLALGLDDKGRPTGMSRSMLNSPAAPVTLPPRRCPDLEL